MKIAVMKETREGETRVAASPETVKKYAGLGAQVVVETGAGAGARFSDDAFKEAGAEIAASAGAAAKGADLILKVQRPTSKELKDYGSGATLAAILAPYAETELL
ncbi:MAG: NAD(P)(+) transhydrogenase (Re/Si-specific) subunit alpha, partial [Pseudomonadota bacterium]